MATCCAWYVPYYLHEPCQDEAECKRWARLRGEARACLASPAVAALLAPLATQFQPETLLQRCLVADLSGKPLPNEAVTPATPHPLRPGSNAGSSRGSILSGASGPGGASARLPVTPNPCTNPGSGPTCNQRSRVAATPGSVGTPAHATSPRGLLAALADMCGYGERGSASGEDWPSAREAEDCMRAWAAFARLLGPAFLYPPALGSMMLKARPALPATAPHCSHARAGPKEVVFKHEALDSYETPRSGAPLQVQGQLSAGPVAASEAWLAV